VITGVRLINVWLLRTRKCCGNCDEVKPIERFSKCKRERDGKQSRCKDCDNKRASDTRKTNRKNYSNYIESRGGKCEICEASYDSEVYVFHHGDPSLKEQGINSNKFALGSAHHLEAEKCHLLCANCHALEHKALREGSTLLTNSSTNET
jgi:predicted HNH restriction endonuclease